MILPMNGTWRWEPGNASEGEKTTRRGGGGWIVFSKTSSLRSEKLFSGSESEWVQSLSAADNK